MENGEWRMENGVFLNKNRIQSLSIVNYQFSINKGVGSGKQSDSGQKFSIFRKDSDILQSPLKRQKRVCIVGATTKKRYLNRGECGRSPRCPEQKRLHIQNEHSAKRSQRDELLAKPADGVRIHRAEYVFANIQTNRIQTDRTIGASNGAHPYADINSQILKRAINTQSFSILHCQLSILKQGIINDDEKYIHAFLRY